MTIPNTNKIHVLVNTAIDLEDGIYSMTHGSLKKTIRSESGNQVIRNVAQLNPTAFCVDAAKASP